MKFSHNILLTPEKGLSSAGGVIILALVGAVIYLFFFRTPKRGTKNFIPLDKKDFAKIIYGEQLNQSPEKTNANLDELEKVIEFSWKFPYKKKIKKN